MKKIIAFSTVVLILLTLNLNVFAQGCPKGFGKGNKKCGLSNENGDLNVQCTESPEMLAFKEAIHWGGHFCFLNTKKA